MADELPRLNADDDPELTTPSGQPSPLPYDDLPSTSPPPADDYTDPLARSSAYQMTQPLGDEPLSEDEDTDDVPFPTIRKMAEAHETDEHAAQDTDVPFHLPHADADEHTLDRRHAMHQMPTMPVFREPGKSDPRRTLVGSGGLDPNPDMTYPSEPTLANMPSVTMPQQTQDHARWQPSAQASPYVAAQGAYVPPPPAPYAGGKPLPTRRPAPRRFLGLPAGCLYALGALVFTVCGGLTFLTVAVFSVFIPYLESQWESELSRVDNYRAFQSTFINDRSGQRLFEVFNEGRRTTVPYERFPRHLINATIAIEDSSFWTNIGIDVPATTVALLQFLGAGGEGNTPGGSTITQQLVRNVLFDPQKRAERSAARKAEEIILAILLTQRRSKEDILTLYLNEIYYGNLAYGAQTAAQVFFSKNVEDLTLGEAALLAGLPQAPADLDPLNPDPAVQARVYARQRQVLDEMVDEGFITPQERDQALAQGLTFNPQQTSLRAPHFTVYAQRELTAIMQGLGYSPADLARGGYTIYTTVDLGITDLALQAARQQVRQLANNRVTNAAVLVLKPLTGEILAMVGSVDYDSTVIDGRVNVTTALRQPGSTMKIFTYSAAIERGMTPGDVLWDVRTDIGIPGQPTYSPRNYDGQFRGPMIMRTALANSYNIPAVQTLRLTGVDYLLQFLRRLGVTSLRQDPGLYGLSLTLGGGEISLVELTAGYATYANLGAYVEPTSILCIVDPNNNAIYMYENGCPQTVNITAQTYQRTGLGRQALDPRIAYLMTDILSDNVARTPAMGANSPLNTPGIASAVKTGTTNDYKDNWTVGYTSNVAVGVWTGNNDGTPMQNVSGLTGAAPIWNAVITGIYNNPAMRNTLAVGGQLLPDKPAPPSGMSQRQICDVRRLTDPSPTCPAFVTEWFLDGGIGIPDAEGNLQFIPPAPLPPNTRTIQLVSPGVFQAYVVPLPPEVAATVQFQINPAAGDKQPPPPRYCLLDENTPPETPGVLDLLFIQRAITSQGDDVEAERFAQSRNLAYMPNVRCPPDISGLGLAAGGSGGSSINVAIITSPGNGQIVSGNVPILGSAQFDPNVVGYYHLYIRGGPFADWTALGQPGRSPVINGQLETLFGAGLPSGQYQLRLALQTPSGDFVQQPYEVTFTLQN
ncbi:MAG: transglycosylase domain-containing protein [Anaerolineae bacterium]